MFNGKSSSEVFYNETENQYFIDRDAKIFRYILNFFRYNRTVLPDNAEELELLQEGWFRNSGTVRVFLSE